MKILLRETLEWVEASYIPQICGFQTLYDTYVETDVVTVKNLVNTDFLVCPTCEATFPNNRKAIEAHKASVATVKRCCECHYAATSGVHPFQLSYKNGQFVYARQVNLSCNCGADIMSDHRLEHCKYASCADETTYRPRTSFFKNHAHAFDVMLTVGVLDNDWSIVSASSYNNRLIYRNEHECIDAAVHNGFITSFRKYTGTMFSLYGRPNNIFYSVTEKKIYTDDDATRTYKESNEEWTNSTLEYLNRIGGRRK